MKKGDKIFVYGTLRPNQRAESKLTGKATHLGTTTLTGAVLHDLGWFPGVELLNTDDVVTGDLFEITDDRLPNMLDAYEGYPNLYDRVKVLTDCQQTAWIYTYNGKFSEKTVIPGGDWAKHTPSEAF